MHSKVYTPLPQNSELSLIDSTHWPRSLARKRNTYHNSTFIYRNPTSPLLWTLVEKHKIHTTMGPRISHSKRLEFLAHVRYQQSMSRVCVLQLAAAAAIALPVRAAPSLAARTKLTASPEHSLAPERIVSVGRHCRTLHVTFHIPSNVLLHNGSSLQSVQQQRGNTAKRWQSTTHWNSMKRKMLLISRL